MSKCFTSYKSPLLSFVPELDDGLQILTCTSFPSPVPKFEWWVSSLSGCSLPRRRSALLLLLLVLSPPPPVAPTTTSPFVIFHRFVTYFVTYFVLWMIFVTLFIEATQFCMTCDVFAFSRFWQHHLQFLGDVSLGSFSPLPGVILFNAEYRFLLRSSFFGGEELLVLEVCSIKLACSRRERFWALHFIGRVWRLVEPVTKTMRPVTCGRSSCCNYKYKHNPIQMHTIQVGHCDCQLWGGSLVAKDQ